MKPVSAFRRGASARLPAAPQAHSPRTVAARLLSQLVQRACAAPEALCPRRLSSTSIERAPAASPSSVSAPVAHDAFDVISHEPVKEHTAVATLYRHKKTGAELLSVVCDEEEKVFGVVFRTPHDGDTGVAHVLEHSVLCGSRKYPVKEPFVALLKSSLQTYLNAMTYPDRTVYPVASPNEKDFHHLVDVYLDAVFHPRLQPWVLQQEGWHLEAAAGSAETSGGGGAGTSERPPVTLAYKGVVYNEMKGVYSSPDSAHAYAADAAMWPASEYGRSSGGDPLAIPGLTFTAFTDFHGTFYHPSNARLFFFGDDDVSKRLAVVASYLDGFEHRTDIAGHAPAGRVRPQPLLPAPIRVSRPYPVAGEGHGGADDGAYGEDDGEGDEYEGEEDLLEEGEGEGEAGGHAPGGGLASVHPSASVPGPAGVGGASGPHAAPSVSTGPHSSHPADEHVASASASSSAAESGASPGTTSSGAVPDKHELSLNWVLHPAESAPDEVTRYGLALVSHLLLRNQTSTLRKALTDGALGSAVIGGGLDDGLAQMTFSVGLKGVKGADIDKVESLILKTLQKAAADGFEADHVASSFNSIEFALREFATGGGPRGLSLFLSAIPGWIYGRDPIQELRFEGPLSALRAAVAADPGYFPRLIRTFLLDNPHRVTVHMYPDPGYNAAREAEEAGRLAELARSMTAEQVEAVRKNAAELLARQAAPDPPEAAATIPTLHISDLPTQVRRIPKAVGTLRVADAAGATGAGASPATGGTGVSIHEASPSWRLPLVKDDDQGVGAPSGMISSGPGAVHPHVGRFLGRSPGHASASASSGVDVSASGAARVSSSSGSGLESVAPPTAQPEYLQHEQPTNGVAYASLYFDVSRLSARLLPLVPLFTWAVTSCGTPATDEVKMSHLLGMHTGGIGLGASVMEVPGSRAAALPLVSVSGKCLAAKSATMGQLMLELVATGRLDRQDRLLHHLKEVIAGHESALVSSGGRYASSLLGAQFSRVGWVNEVWGGLTSLATARTLVHRLTTGAEGGFEGLHADLEAVRSGLLTRDNLLVSAIGDEACLAGLDGALRAMVSGLPASPAPALVAQGAVLSPTSGGPVRRCEGWAWSPVDATSASGRSSGSGSGSAPAAVWRAPGAEGERALPLWPLPPGDGGSGDSGAAPPARIALVVPTQVNYVVKAGPGYDVERSPSSAAAGTFLHSRGGPVPGSAEVLTGQLRTGYLWERVRVQGGAYGGGVSVNRHTGMVGFSSYRDPNLGATLDVFDGTGEHVRGMAAAHAAAVAGGAAPGSTGVAVELEKAVISTVGSLDAPMAPVERGDVSTARHLLGITHGCLQVRRDEVLATGPADLEPFAAALDRVAASGRVAVVTSEAALKAHTGAPFDLVLHPLQKGAQLK